MIKNVHHTQPVDPEDLEAKLRWEDFKLLVSISPLSIDDHTDASRNNRNCPPRLSEPPTSPPDCSPRLSETPTEDDEEYIERCKPEAKQVYDTLIQMGGRPTRPIRWNLHWKTVLFSGEQFYQETKEEEELFYEGTTKPRPAAHPTEIGVIVSHWAAEKKRLDEELRRWQDFLDTQQWRREHRPEFAREEEMKRQQYPQDPELTASLKKLNDWKEYQGYFRRWIDRGKQIIERARRAVEAIQRKDPEVVVNQGKAHGRSDRGWLETIETQREKLAAEEKRLAWVKKQLPAVLLECAASLIELPTSRRQMVERSELEAKRVYTTLVDTGGRPSRPIRPVPDVYDAEHTDEHIHTLCHWEGECSQFEEELREWKTFLNYRQKKGTNGKIEAQLEEQQSTESPTQVDLWTDYRAYQQLEVDNAKQWIAFWQRQVEEFQNIKNRCALQGWTSTAERYDTEAEDARSYAEEARKQVEPLESRLKWIEQQLSALLAECAVSTPEVCISKPLEDQAIPPKRASKSSRTTLKDLRSNQSSRSTLRGNRKPNKNEKRASVNSALGPIHSSKISKAVRRKTPRHRQSSKISAERDDLQKQDHNKTISPPPPANVTRRRSRRLSTNPKRSSTLEADQAANLRRNAQPQPVDVMPRRSDRILQQKARMSTSTSCAALSSVGILRTTSFPRSKPEGRSAGNKSAPSPVKPRGISKR